MVYGHKKFGGSMRYLYGPPWFLVLLLIRGFLYQSEACLPIRKFPNQLALVCRCPIGILNKSSEARSIFKPVEAIEFPA
jgi:hypothetical protein